VSDVMLRLLTEVALGSIFTETYTRRSSWNYQQLVVTCIRVNIEHDRY